MIKRKSKIDRAISILQVVARGDEVPDEIAAWIIDEVVPKLFTHQRERRKFARADTPRLPRTPNGGKLSVP